MATRLLSTSPHHRPKLFRAVRTRSSIAQAVEEDLRQAPEREQRRARVSSGVNRRPYRSMTSGAAAVATTLTPAAPGRQVNRRSL
jgi:hypothetical protein